ncbi:inhibin beta C chain-like [Pelobates cultripes]|uniref:Inhibin beta C chain-like n=1 Tax=Pelobates cultripes TaxID=61616 RepID=A0AAD1R8E1_PELCU|nr:inhibin beta C chain-like [Pelobates cultripes]
MTIQLFLALLLVTMQALLTESFCSACSMSSQPLDGLTTKDILIEVAKQNILNKLHLRQRPNISYTVSRQTLEEALQRLNLRPDSGAEFSKDNEEDSDDLDTNQDYEIISFADIDNSETTRATLHFHLSTEKSKQREIIHADVWLYLYTVPGRKVTLSLTTSLLKQQSSEDMVQIEVVRNSWYTVPLPSLTKRVLNDGDENIYLELKCLNCYYLPLMKNITDSQHPFLVVKAHNIKEASRNRRHITDCLSDMDMCCLKNFYIDFKEIGWSDWIISPEGYNMNLCEGRCPIHLSRVPGIAASSHTAIFSLIKANNVYSSLSSCCIPTKRRPLSVLYFDKNNAIVKTDIPDMIVESCGCT